MKSSRLVIIGVCVAGGLIWGMQRSKAAQLRLQREINQRESAELARLRREHERLQRAQLSEEEMARLRRAVASAPVAPTVAGEVGSGDAGVLKPGMWTATTEWRNRGRATPIATLETMLWASAGGDLAVLKSALEFDDDSRAKALAMLARVPEIARQYGTSEDFLASMVAGNIPLDSVQAVARQQFGTDDALEFIRLKSLDGSTRQACLTLRRGADGWKVRVPGKAVDNLTRSSVPTH